MNNHFYIRKIQRLFFLVLLLTLPLQQTVEAKDLFGLVVKIADGDTLTILDGQKKQIRVRLAEIDTPESKQTYGNRAKQELSRLVFGKTVSVKVQDTDRYGRTVGRVYVERIDVNAAMVRFGAAWVYRRYAKDPNLFFLESKARENGIGLWSLPESQRTPPWEWRKAN